MPLNGVENTVKKFRLHENCTGLVLAVSGGPDSMAMLHWYARKAPEFPLYVAHVHHGLRPESDQEAQTVEEYCNGLDLPCRVFRTNVKEELQKGETVESAARRLRYGFFRILAQETGASHLATAHTRDDQCETVLLHLLHGAGPKGLCGIFPKREEGPLTLIRPLIEREKEQILSYCNANGIPYARDPSNEETVYTRNRIRHILLPEMEKINPNVRQALCRTAQTVQRQQAGLEVRAKQFLESHPRELPVRELRALPEGEQAEILRQLFARQGKQLSFEQTENALELLKKETGSLEFDRTYRLHLGQNIITLSQPKQPLPQISVTGEETPLPDGRILRVTKGQCTPSNRRSLVRPTGAMTLRPRQPGDSLRTPGGTKTLKKRMIELKIPQQKRDTLWVLADEEGVLWCEVLGMNQDKTPNQGEEGYFITLSEK